MIPDCDTYIKNANGNYESLKNDTDKMKDLMKDALKLKITGIVKPKEDAKNAIISSALGYTRALTEYIIDKSNNSDIVKAQESNKNVNVLNGMDFSPSSDEDKIKDTKTYLQNLGISDKAKFFKSMMTSMNPAQGGNADMDNLNETQLAGMLDQYLQSPDENVLLAIYNTKISTGTYEDNLTAFGKINLDAPTAINIYTDSFENKESLSNCIEEYNNSANEDDKITYTDFMGMLLSSVTTIIDVISYVLIAFVGVSLVVSSIMIGIITFISVMERTKEIGILRAIGASKHNISEVFNAETIIIGLFSGILGIVITELLLIPANEIIHMVLDNNNVNAVLPIPSAIALIVLSVILTIIGGLIPAKKASRKNPVTALRTE